MSIQKAKLLWERLQRGETENDGGPEFMTDRIRAELLVEGATIQALAEQGESLDAMESQMKETVSAQLLHQAQTSFVELIGGELGRFSTAQQKADSIRGKLARAGKDASHLDPEPAVQKTAQEMETALRRAVLHHRLGIGSDMGTGRG